MAALAIAAGGVRGAQVRHSEIDEATPAGWMMLPVVLERMPKDERWLGQFTPRGIPLVATGQLADSTLCFFAIAKDSHLRREGALIDPLLSWQRIRVIGLLGKA